MLLLVDVLEHHAEGIDAVAGRARQVQVERGVLQRAADGDRDGKAGGEARRGVELNRSGWTARGRRGVGPIGSTRPDQAAWAGMASPVPMT